MSGVTVKQFAEVVGIPVDRLLAQFHDAGLDLTSADDKIDDDQKMQLLNHLRRSHGKEDSGGAAEPKKITLKRRSVSELKLSGAQGRSKTVSVEVRKKRTYVKRSVVMEEEAQRKAEETKQRQEEEQARLAAEAKEAEERRKQEEEKRKVEEETRQKAEQEAREKAEEAAKLREEEERRKAEEEARKEAEQDEKKQQ
ncbi:MAG: translation initiation factor IF-2 associated domain-containing protein, partial [Gammaproteobacteria bacterium]|nr:translation initiation factor IF-2 associated domain-containing protein [Gammaproteobacteria bacterium]